MDNGPEFAAKALDEWAHRHRVKLAFSRPGTPTDNPFIEAFHGRFRQACLDQNWFASLELDFLFKSIEIYPGTETQQPRR